MTRGSLDATVVRRHLLAMERARRNLETNEALDDFATFAEHIEVALTAATAGA